jgi:tRNA dimethylallyltransferase
MLLLTGPTACGKSDVALALARRTGGEVVCADAFQLYTGLPVLTAQPSAADMAAAPHHLYGSVPLTEDMDAAKFAHMAAECITEIESRGRLAIVTGGSGLYIKALTHGLSPLPPADAALRGELDVLSADERIARLLALDPVAGESVSLTNPRYVQRALEIAILTGRPVAEQRQSFTAGPRPGIRGIFLLRDRAELYARINARTLTMLELGALDEVRALPGDISVTAEKTIGLRELRAVLAGEMTLPDATTVIQQTTRRYAKRQETWFRRETWMETVECTGRSAEEIAGGIACFGPRAGPLPH